MAESAMVRLPESATVLSTRVRLMGAFYPQPAGGLSRR